MKNFKLEVKPGQHDIIVTYELSAPVAKVFKAYTEAEAIKKWWGGRTYKTDLIAFEPHAGGSWNFMQKGPDGNSYGFHGVFHEVAENERIIWTFEFDDLPDKGHVALETVYFTEENGITKVRNLSVFQSVADRDGMVASGMEKGLREGLDVLSELVEA